jgi:hypothetical protein
MSYEIFDSQATRVYYPALTVRADLRIAFNLDAGSILSSLGAKYAQILWDRERYRLAIRPLAKPDARAFKLSFAKSKRGPTIASQSFLKYIQWEAGKPFTTAVNWDEKEGLLEAVLPRERVGLAAPGKSRK